MKILTRNRKKQSLSTHSRGHSHSKMNAPVGGGQDGRCARAVDHREPSVDRERAGPDPRVGRARQRKRLPGIGPDRRAETGDGKRNGS